MDTHVAVLILWWERRWTSERRPDDGFFGEPLRDCIGRWQGDFACGVAYELQQSEGQWFETPIYTFQGQQDGASPTGPLTFDTEGNLYGTTTGGGTFSAGGVFQLAPPTMQGQIWTESTLHSFGSVINDGLNPMAGVTLGPRGTLVGTTYQGGAFGAGTVFGLAPPLNSGGQWGYKVLYSFGGVPGDGGFPSSGLTLVTSSNGTTAYGTTSVGGSSNIGTVFQLNQSGPGTWSEAPVYSFTGGRDGGVPLAGLLLENFALYGTTSIGGISNTNCPFGCGTIFRLAH